MKIILASNSPRRKELLRKANVDFEVIPATLEEKVDNCDSVYELAKKLATNKATEVFLKHGGIVIGADTIVSYNGKVFNKPRNEKDAIETLTSLSGKTHEVITGFAIISKDVKIISYEVTKVTFNNLSENHIKEYVKTGLPLDKAGSYGIQDGYNLVKSIDGSYSNVVGLPVEKIVKILREMQ